MCKSTVPCVLAAWSLMSAAWLGLPLMRAGWSKCTLYRMREWNHHSRAKSRCSHCLSRLKTYLMNASVHPQEGRCPTREHYNTYSCGSKFVLRAMLMFPLSHTADCEWLVFLKCTYYKGMPTFTSGRAGYENLTFLNWTTGSSLAGTTPLLELESIGGFWCIKTNGNTQWILSYNVCTSWIYS